MLIVITGASASGKSEYAEKTLVANSLSENNRYYIATMMPTSSESGSRIAKHRSAREGRNFKTVEKYRNIHTLCDESLRDSYGSDTIPINADVILECMSNLAANEMFDEDALHYGDGPDNIADHIILGIDKLSKRCHTLVVVTNEVFSDGNEYDTLTMEYIRLLGGINRRLADMADRLVEVVYGIPVDIKR